MVQPSVARFFMMASWLKGLLEVAMPTIWPASLMAVAPALVKEPPSKPRFTTLLPSMKTAAAPEEFRTQQAIICPRALISSMPLGSESSEPAKFVAPVA